MPLDLVDRRMLEILQDDGRISNAALAERLHLSPSPCLRRLRALESEGVIRGYRAEIDPRALGLPLSVIIRMRPAPRELHKVAELAVATPEVVECLRMTGEDCYLIRAHVRDVEHLEEVIDRFALYGQTTSSILQSAPVPARGLPL